MNIHDEKIKISVIGLGYVGLPLAIEFSKKYDVVGFDTDKARIQELIKGNDTTNEVDFASISPKTLPLFTSNENDIADANVFVVTVPTPINHDKSPNLEPLENASKIVGNFLSPNDVVIFESTVFPGATEEFCAPILERFSGLRYSKNSREGDQRVFHLGYSPERINPGDEKHRLTNIQKITSGSCQKTAEFVNSLYASIITAGTYMAESIKIAEAAKIIENTQRDVNIALINEFAMLFNELGLDTEQVLKAAETKWNFLSFRPGLVGGHCIGVDPYYLTYKAEQVGFKANMITAGRQINDGMSKYLSTQIKSLIEQNDISIQGAKILILGVTFKENCPDIRNSKVIDLIQNLAEAGADVDCFDPYVSSSNLPPKISKNFRSNLPESYYDCVVLAVPHKYFLEEFFAKLKKLGNKNHVFYDLKSCFPIDFSHGRL